MKNQNPGGAQFSLENAGISLKLCSDEKKELLKKYTLTYILMCTSVLLLNTFMLFLLS